MKNIHVSMIASCLMSCNLLGIAETPEELKALFVEDTQLLHGEFSNGLTYFIKKNTFDAKKASLRLAVKIGSIHEEEHERGLAHFVEHMVFRGSEHFKDGEVIKFLETIGASFGRHTNAYTGFDETVYMLDIPLDNLANLEVGLKILSDFASKASFGTQELEIEKGVVLDEMRQREAASRGRLSNNFCEKILDNTLYGKRLPIGLESVIKECTQDKISSFYSKWYQPENIAIIAVGDFDPSYVLDLVESHFGKISSHENITNFSLPSISNAQRGVSIVNNPDNPGAYMFFSSWIENEDGSSIEGLKLSVIDKLITSMVNRRFSILSEQENSPFSNANMFFGNIIKPKRSFIVQSICWDKRPEDGVLGVVAELEKIRQHSFDAAELELAKNILKSRLDQALKNAQSQNNAVLANNYIRSFKFGYLNLSTEEAAKLESMLLDFISLDEVIQRSEALINPDVLSVTYFPSDNTSPLSSERICQLIDQTKNKVFSKESQNTKSFDLKQELSLGEILINKISRATNIEQLELSNHMKVILLPSDVKKNMFQCYLRAEGGIDHTSEDILPSAKNAMGYLAKSGLFGFSATELSDVLAGKNVKLQYSSYFDRTVRAEASNDDMLYLFKLIQGLFTARNSSKNAWKQSIEENDQLIALKESNSELQFGDLQNNHNFGYHYAFRLHESKEMNQEKADMYLEKAFSNPSEYTMIIVGDYNREALLEALKTYIASIPNKGKFLKKEFSQFNFPKEITEVAIESSSTKDESTFVMAFPIQNNHLIKGYKSYFLIDLLENLLTRRFLETLRMKEGETYGVHIFGYFPFYPEPVSGRFFISFSCSQVKGSFMKSLILEEIKKAKESFFTEEELNKAFEICKHHHAKSQLTLEGLKEKVEQNCLFNHGFNDFIQDRVLEKKPSLIELQSLLCDLIDLNNFSVCVRRPLEK